jgi:cytoskeleton protein RodZ
VTVPLAPLTPAPGAAAPATAPATVPAGAASAVPAAPAADAANRPVLVQASQQSWLEARDATGRVLISRLLAPGESVGLDGSFPLTVRVGNAAATQLTVRGRPFDITPHVRNNVAGFDIP